MHLLVTGASGLLGLNLCMLAVEKGYEVTGLVHSRSMTNVPFSQVSIDLTHKQAARKVVQTIKPDAVIHCAAIADLNIAQRNPQLAKRLNSEIPGRLAGEAHKAAIPFIHISTDAVFDGQGGNYNETDDPHPLSVYAQTKLAGEENVLTHNPDASIARVVFYGWSLSGKRSLSEFFFNNLSQGKSVMGFVDTTFSPLYVEDLSGVLLEMLQKRLNGIYHVVSPEAVSKYEFGVRIANRFGFDVGLITPVEARDLNREAPRALNLSLNPNKIQTALGHQLSSIDEGIELFYQRWQEGYPEKLQSFAG
jgi:dTDP-4-dehydrorhamnose reductase